MKTITYLSRMYNFKHLCSLVTLCIFFSLSTVTFAQSTKQNFSGKWMINTEKNESVSGGEVKGIIIEQNNDTIIFRSIFYGNGEQTYSNPYKYILDGSTLTTDYEEGWEEVVAKWSENGKCFTISSSYFDGADGEYDENTWDEYELSADLKTLTNRHSKDFGSITTIVFDKAAN